jgi:hypothetical protein
MSQPKPTSKPGDKPAAAGKADKPKDADPFAGKQGQKLDAPSAGAPASKGSDPKKDDDATMKDAKDKPTDGADKPEAKMRDGKREVKRSPNRLIVDESHGDGDNSCVMLSTAKMEGTQNSGHQARSRSGRRLSS